MKTLYEILEVSENASDEVIEKAYKVLAKKYHPDLQTPENKKTAESKMKEINDAYDVLGNSEKRKNYDNEIKSKREEERRQQEYNTGASTYKNKESYNTNPQNQANMQNQYNQMNEMRQREYEENLLREEARMRREMQANLEQEYQNAYYDYLRSLGFKIKEKWTWKKTKELMIIIVIFFAILGIMWILPPTRQMMIDFYESNRIFQVLVDIVVGIIRGLFNAIKSIFTGG